MDLSSATLGQIALQVSDLDRAIEFYRDALGLTFLFRAPQLGFFRVGDVRLMLGLPEAGEARRSGALLYFKVPDITTAHATLLGRGVEFRDHPHVVHRAPDHDLWMVALDDPDGNTLILMEERPREES